MTLTTVDVELLAAEEAEAKVDDDGGALVEAEADVSHLRDPPAASFGSALIGFPSRTFWMAFRKASRFFRLALKGKTRLSVP